MVNATSEDSPKSTVIKQNGLKNPAWVIPAAILQDGKWVERPDNKRKITLWEHFDQGNIMKGFYGTMTNYQLGR